MCQRIAIVALLLAVVASAFARKEETLEQLAARADSAHVDQQPNLCMEVAERALKAGTDAYKANQDDQFRSSLQQVITYSDKARSAAINSRKHIKSTEIKIRKISERLKDLKLNVNYDDQATVQAVIDKLEKFRTDLLQSMFGSRGND
jgi:hypothetical protein